MNGLEEAGRELTNGSTEEGGALLGEFEATGRAVPAPQSDPRRLDGKLKARAGLEHETTTNTQTLRSRNNHSVQFAERRDCGSPQELRDLVAERRVFVVVTGRGRGATLLGILIEAEPADHLVDRHALDAGGARGSRDVAVVGLE